jgi:hypothetical protein
MGVRIYLAKMLAWHGAQAALPVSALAAPSAARKSSATVEQLNPEELKRSDKETTDFSCGKPSLYTQSAVQAIEGSRFR